MCKYGVPIQIITDNDTQFTRKTIRTFCKDSNIKLSFASVNHPQENGQVETVNKTIIKILRRKTIPEHGQILSRKSILWTYRTTHKTATGQTSYMLVFGLEAVELVWPTTKIKHFSVEENEEAMTLEQEDLEEKRHG